MEPTGNCGKCDFCRGREYIGKFSVTIPKKKATTIKKTTKSTTKKSIKVVRT